MHILFANTGVQLVCVPLKGGSRYNVQQVGNGWQRTVCNINAGKPEAEDPRSIKEYPYIQWQIIQTGENTKLFFAIDTTCGDPEIGYFCDASALTGDYPVELRGLLDVSGNPLKGVPETQIVIRPATATSGEPKQVHMIIDFGNSRTGALLLEVVGEISQTPQMIPFELTNRYHLNQYNELGEYMRMPENRWFSSKTHWSTAPYLPPIKQKKIQFHIDESAPQKKSWFGFGSASPRQTKVEVQIAPELFQDLSQVRMGKECDDLLQVITPDGDIRTGVSSPKRYLWADDSSWLEGANWHMCDPHNTCGTNVYCDNLHGPLMKFIHEDDNDFLLKEGGPQERDFATDMPLKPRHAPRAMMTAALYEMICQAYTYINSMAYRTSSGDAGRARELRTITMTYPSGMITEEKDRLRMQVQKAIEIFTRTLGRFQRVRPLLNLSIDEASAVHLTYIWSELGLLGQDPRIWFSTIHQDRGEVVVEAPPEENMLQMGAVAGRRRGGVARPGKTGSQKEEIEIGDKKNEIRIACLDIGGGTTDLMIASYNYESKIDDYIHGKTLHQDGISLGGDQMVKRLLETIIIPQFAESLNMEEEDVQLLFGPEVPRNREFKGQRIAWMNRLFIPLTNEYLKKAVEGEYQEPISHTDPEIVDPSILESLQSVFDKLKGPGYYTVETELDLTVNKEEFDGVIHDVFDELIYDMCQRCVQYKADVVLLAGQPTKLDYIRKLVRMYLPLSPSRIVPMYGHYAGNWYPYQDEKGTEPGVIIDPKSPVVVGAAIEFMAANGMLPQFKYSMQAKQYENSYYWGVMGGSTSGIRNERILFKPVDENSREEITDFTTSSQRVIIGRKMSENEDAQATPIYILKMEVGDRIGRTEVQVKIKRIKATGESEEHLEVDSVMGIVAGQDAVLGENVFFSWRTLADERYYLDTGGLDNIEIR